jgi:hypothetical protein
MGKGG